MVLAQRTQRYSHSIYLEQQWKKSDALLVRSLEDRLRTLRFLQWLSPQFTVLSYSTVQPFICIFGRCLTESLLCNIQRFYWACPVDSGSRRRANGLEKRLLSRPRRTSLHHSRSSRSEKESYPRAASPDPSPLSLTSFPLSQTAPSQERYVTELSITLVGFSALLSLPLTLPVDWNCCHSKSIRDGSYITLSTSGFL